MARLIQLHARARGGRWIFGQFRTRKLRNRARKLQSANFASSQITTVLRHTWREIAQDCEISKVGSTPVRAAKHFHSENRHARARRKPFRSIHELQKNKTNWQ